MDANKINSLRSDLNKDVEAAKKAFEAARSNVASIEAQYLSKLGSAKAALKDADGALRAKAAELVKFNSVFGEHGAKANGKPYNKPGPKPGSKRVKAEAVVHAKPGPKPGRKKPGPKPGSKRVKAEAGAKRKPGPKSAASKRAAEGRRAVLEGKRPAIKDAIKKIMGTRVVSSQEIFDELTKRDWLPNSNNPRQYVSYVLSSNKEHFESVKGKGRGHYRVISGATTVHAKPGPKPGAKKPGPKPKAKAAATVETTATKTERKKPGPKPGAKAAARAAAAAEAAKAAAEPAKVAEPKAAPEAEAKAAPETVQTAEDILSEVKDAFGTSAST